MLTYSVWCILQHWHRKNLQEDLEKKSQSIHCTELEGGESQGKLQRNWRPDRLHMRWHHRLGETSVSKNGINMCKWHEDWNEMNGVFSPSLSPPSCAWQMSDSFDAAPPRCMTYFTHLIHSVSADSCKCLLVVSDRWYKMEIKTKLP